MRSRRLVSCSEGERRQHLSCSVHARRDDQRPGSPSVKAAVHVCSLSVDACVRCSPHAAVDEAFRESFLSQSSYPPFWVQPFDSSPTALKSPSGSRHRVDSSGTTAVPSPTHWPQFIVSLARRGRRTTHSERRPNLRITRCTVA